MGERRSMPTLLLTALLLVALAEPARAALFMEFEPPRGSPGTVVVGRTAGEGALTVAPGRAFPVYLVVDGSDRRTPIGHVRVDARGNGHLEFEVPDVAGATYTVLMSCPPCAPYSAGRTEVPLGEFRVLGPAVAPRLEPSQSPWVSIAVLLVICALLGGLMLHRRKPSPGVVPIDPERG